MHKVHLQPKKKRLYKPLPISSEPWESVSILLEWNGMDIILVVFDQFSKLAKMVPIKMVATTFNLTKFLFDIWVKHDGMPQFIISNKNAKFLVGF
jgi:hypothetical protein